MEIYDRDKAIKAVERANEDMAIFTDASARSGLVGVGVSHCSRTACVAISKATGSRPLLTIHYAELLAIQEASHLVDIPWSASDNHPSQTVTVYTDSQSALKSLSRPW